MSEIAFVCFCNRRLNVLGLHRLRGTLTQSLKSGSAWPTRTWRAIRGNRWLGSARLVHALSCCYKYWIDVNELNLRFARLGKPYYLLLCIPIVVPYFKSLNATQNGNEASGSIFDPAPFPRMRSKPTSCVSSWFNGNYWDCMGFRAEGLGGTSHLYPVVRDKSLAGTRFPSPLSIYQSVLRPLLEPIIFRQQA